MSNGVVMLSAMMVCRQLVLSRWCDNVLLDVAVKRCDDVSLAGVQCCDVSLVYDLKWSDDVLLNDVKWCDDVSQTRDVKSCDDVAVV